jgi:hypothetical protein
MKRTRTCEGRKQDNAATVGDIGSASFAGHFVSKAHAGIQRV